ncbi:helix-turn-helix domain-containing protein [Pseudomonas aeruginosa]|uniref:helix-turn-helix domain-containing protein n=1 Tax=Pseudomonas aeruginosa TaxID=287 RepID=UPI0022720CD5|nr:helix-turn-helix domain-containing protein [Pseudomonas aeruginosa]MCY0368103.1 helix-turn-helix domain-containing protein [Pseudomonas aeruginosa]MCY0375400.1 helix-turn-helix domain-containing protein [Pseudomonas aeruginosa]
MTDLFADKLIRLRTQKGLTQRDLAAMAGLSWSQISKYESGKSKPRKKALWALEEALGCPGELAAFAEGTKIAVEVPAGLYERLEQAAAEAQLSIDEYKHFFLARLIAWSHDEILGIRPPTLFSKEEIEQMQNRMDPGEADSQREKRLKQIKDGSDDESMILAELEERKIFDGRSTKNK